MGYSCTRDAQDTLAVISHRFATDGNPNVWTIGTVQRKQYFFERGRENEDGAITGTLMVMLDGDMCRPVGSVRIAPDGTIERFPKLIARDRAELEYYARDVRARNPQWISSWQVPL
jgi:hypothetical protein